MKACHVCIGRGSLDCAHCNNTRVEPGSDKPERKEIVLVPSDLLERIDALGDDRNYTPSRAERFTEWLTTQTTPLSLPDVKALARWILR